MPPRDEDGLGNFRASSVLGELGFFGSEVMHNFVAFKARCDVIMANRWSDELADMAVKVYMRDLFKKD